MTIVDNDPGDEWVATELAEMCERWLDRYTKGDVVSAIFPMSEPDPMSESEVRDALRGAAGDAEQTIDSAPCEEHKVSIRQAADLLRGVAQEIEDVQRNR